MAVSETLLNFRENSMPQLRINEGGERTFSKQYRAVIQVLVEGSTSDFLSWNRAFFGDIGDGSTSPPFDFRNITIDDQNTFNINSDIHPDDTSKGDLLYVVSELTANYDKVSSYGKMTGTYQLDITGPVIVLNLETAQWEKLDPTEY